MKAKVTLLKKKKQDRKEKILWDFQTQMAIYGAQKMGVAGYLAKKYKVSIATILRCV